MEKITKISLIISSNENKNNKFENLEFQFFLQQENNFLKNEINQKQKTIDKLLDLNWLQSKDQYKVNDDNKTDKKNVEMPQLHNGKPSVKFYDLINSKVIAAENPKTIILKSVLMVIVKPR